MIDTPYLLSIMWSLVIILAVRIVFDIYVKTKISVKICRYLGNDGMTELEEKEYENVN